MVKVDHEFNWLSVDKSKEGKLSHLTIDPLNLSYFTDEQFQEIRSFNKSPKVSTKVHGTRPTSHNHYCFEQLSYQSSSLSLKIQNGLPPTFTENRTVIVSSLTFVWLLPSLQRFKLTTSKSGVLRNCLVVTHCTNHCKLLLRKCRKEKVNKIRVRLETTFSQKNFSAHVNKITSAVMCTTSRGS